MKIGCVILAGGKSSRMGRDKALLDINGKTFIECISEELSYFEEKLIARGNNELLQGIEWKIIPDIYVNRGPLGGLHAALTVCESDVLMCVSCDMPLIQKSLVNSLCASMENDWDAVIVKEENGRVHPLCGVYRKEIVSILEEQLQSGNNRVRDALERMKVKYFNIDFEEITQQLLNVNTPEQFQEIIKK